jgi:hypothetical protein
MTLLVSDIGHGQLAIAGESIAASSSEAVTRVTHCTFYNAHTAVVTVTVYYLRVSENISGIGVLKAKKQIAPGGTWLCLEVTGQNIGNSGSLFAVPSIDNVIHYNVSGDAIS